MDRPALKLLLLCSTVTLLSCSASASLSLSPFTEPCNGQGIVYSENYTACECFDCFYGASCESTVDDCVVNVAGGEPFQMTSGGNSTLTALLRQPNSPPGVLGTD